MNSSTITAGTPTKNIHLACTSAITIGALLVAEARFQSPSEQITSVHSTSGQCRLSSFFSVTPSAISLHHGAGCHGRRGNRGRRRDRLFTLHLEIGCHDLRRSGRGRLGAPAAVLVQ